MSSNCYPQSILLRQKLTWHTQYEKVTILCCYLNIFKKHFCSHYNIMVRWPTLMWFWTNETCVWYSVWASLYLVWYRKDTLTRERRFYQEFKQYFMLQYCTIWWFDRKILILALWELHTNKIYLLIYIIVNKKVIMIYDIRQAYLKCILLLL